MVERVRLSEWYVFMTSLQTLDEKMPDFLLQLSASESYRNALEGELETYTSIICPIKAFLILLT